MRSRLLIITALACWSVLSLLTVAARSDQSKLGFMASLSGWCTTPDFGPPENGDAVRDAFVNSSRAVNTAAAVEVVDIGCSPIEAIAQLESLLDESQVEFVFAYTQQSPVAEAIKQKLSLRKKEALGIVFQSLSAADGIKAGSIAPKAWADVLTTVSKSDREIRVKRTNDYLQARFWRYYVVE